MKRVFVGFVALMMVEVAHADLMIKFWNQAIGIQDNAVEQNFLLPGSVAQLIWSQTGAIDEAGGYAVDANADRGQSDGAGGYVLAREETAGNYGLWGGDEAPEVLYTNADIGGLLDINTGYFFARVFENIGGIGESFMDVPMASAADWVYDAGPPANPTTIFSQNALPGAPGSVMYVGAYATYVIPEPATICFMGLGLVGLRMWRFRRKIDG